MNNKEYKNTGNVIGGCALNGVEIEVWRKTKDRNQVMLRAVNWYNKKQILPLFYCDQRELTNVKLTDASRVDHFISRMKRDSF